MPDSTKINLLLQKWPKATLATQKWLTEMGISRNLAKIYEKSRWIKKLAPGVYYRTGDEVDWSGAVYALQKITKLSVHIGGQTALELSGFSNFLKPGRMERVFLYKRQGQSIPKWLLEKNFGARIQIKATNFINLPASKKELGLKECTLPNYSLVMSTPERAMLEFMLSVPNEFTVDSAMEQMENMFSLRPDLVSKLLEACSSVKAKRLFMALAEEFDHAWIKKINLTDVDFGNGRRQITKGGKYNKRYDLVI